MPFEPFPKNDPALRLRLRRQLMGLLSYVMFLFPLLYSIHHGWMRIGYPGLALFSAAALSVNLGYFVAIRSGWSRRLADPGMTFAQIATAMALALVMIHLAGEARSIFLMLFFSSLFFGVFGLSKRQFLLLSAAAVLGYVLLIGYEFHDVTGDDPRLRLEILRVMTLAMILLWLSLLGSYVADLRKRLAGKHEELAQAMTRLRDLVLHDELTGAFNRRHLMDILASETVRAERLGDHYSVCILDLDHFKHVNDEYGHAAGDDVLKEFSRRMSHGSRKIDSLGRQGADIDSTFGRYGGEEFLLVMPHTPLAGARLCIERIRIRVQDEPFVTVAGPLTVTFSAGVAERQRGESVASVLARADEALYRAKANGRNRAEVSE